MGEFVSVPVGLASQILDLVLSFLLFQESRTEIGRELLGSSLLRAKFPREVSCWVSEGA